ncbi:hypothetical protein VP01_9871g1, partial [Puccinia sorghi]
CFNYFLGSYKDDKLISQASGFAAISKDCLKAINHTKNMLKAKNEISQERLKIEEK